MIVETVENQPPIYPINNCRRLYPHSLEFIRLEQWPFGTTSLINNVISSLEKKLEKRRISTLNMICSITKSNCLAQY